MTQLPGTALEYRGFSVIIAALENGAFRLVSLVKDTTGNLVQTDSAPIIEGVNGSRF
jgi:hypothetical protein